MRSRTDAEAESLFDISIEIGEKLVAKVDETAAREGAPDRDELLDMGVHALSALLGGRQPARGEDVLGECMDVARALIAEVDRELGENASEEAREELLDTAVHVQTAILNSRPKMPAEFLANRCVTIAKDLIARIDAAKA
jgi:metal-responsive CopG/Arc/MetJ family transcriptional regulator